MSTTQQQILSSTAQRLFVILFIGLLAASPAFAATGGISSVNSILQWVATTLTSVAVLVITIAIIWCGYKFAFAHARVMELVPVFVGAILIGGASEIASMMLSNSSISS